MNKDAQKSLHPESWLCRGPLHRNDSLLP
jgi:hypothetical protein